MLDRRLLEVEQVIVYLVDQETSYHLIWSALKIQC